MEQDKAIKKRQRSENWLEEDKLILMELVRERVSIIENKNTDTNTNSKKLAAWADLLCSFKNMCRGGNRTLAQLKSQWGIIKMSKKKIKAAERKQTFMTGGGPPPQRNPGDSLGDISAWLPNEFTIDSNEFDSDQISQIKYDTASTSKKIEVYDTIMIVEEKDDDASMKEDRIIEDVEEATMSYNDVNRLDAPSFTPSKTSRRKEDDNKDSKKSAVKETAQTPRRKEGSNNKISSAASIAENEIRCRNELHQAQMQNEAWKTSILSLKEELIRKKIEYYEQKKNIL